jgi:hypothetical protein
MRNYRGRRRQSGRALKGLRSIRKWSKMTLQKIRDGRGNFEHKRLLMHATRNMASTHLSILLELVLGVV